MSERSVAIKRARALIEQDPALEYCPEQATLVRDVVDKAERGLALYLAQAGVSAPPWMLIISCLLLGLGACWLFSQFLSPWFSPLFFAVGSLMPVSFLERRVNARADEFAQDYPTVLLAASSSLKAGMTAMAALERAVRLLPGEGLVRQEVDALLLSLNKGVPRREALERFARTIRQPDLVLFRAAFLLALENGGRFAPTLERLARICRDRSTLIHAARVSTATMRMTSNILLAVAPLILLLVSLRSKDYWHLFFHHPVANTVASAGIVIIGISVLGLRRMSRFKP